MVNIERVSTYSNQADSSRFAVLRVANSIQKELGGRHSWVEISNSKNGKKIYRTLRGAGSKSIKLNHIELDYDGILDLELDFSLKNKNEYNNCDLKIRQIKSLKILFAHWNHPDPAYRVPMRLALFMGFISFISLFTSLISLNN